LAGHHLDAALRQSLFRVGTDVRLEHREDLGAGLDEQDPRLLVRQVAVVFPEDTVVEFCEGSCCLDAGRTPAHDDDVQGPVVDQLSIPVRTLPRAQHVVLEPNRVGQRVEGEAVFFGAFDAEEVDLRAEPEDEVVVAVRLELLETHLPAVEVDLRDRVLVQRCVVLLVEEIPERMPNRRLLEEAGGDLVEERLERVVVVLVHDHDVHVALPQLLRGAHAAESASEDEDAGTLAVLVVASAHGSKPSVPLAVALEVIQKG
jgi:hypothetical protein